MVKKKESACGGSCRLSIDMVAPIYGQHTVKEYFREISEVTNA